MSRNYPNDLRLRKSATVRSPLGRVGTVLGILVVLLLGQPQSPTHTSPGRARFIETRWCYTCALLHPL
eukprot:9424108-Pyramimonas_sp.AAC.1